MEDVLVAVVRRDSDGQYWFSVRFKKYLENESEKMGQVVFTVEAKLDETIFTELKERAQAEARQRGISHVINLD